MPEWIGSLEGTSLFSWEGVWGKGQCGRHLEEEGLQLGCRVNKLKGVIEFFSRENVRKEKVRALSLSTSFHSVGNSSMHTTGKKKLYTISASYEP